MLELFNHLALGFNVAFSPENILYAFVGCLVGTLIGVLPGLGPITAIAMLLPLTYALTPVAALIMLAGIYYGAQYGGSTTSILVNLPGEPSSVVTAIEGYRMAKKGRAGAALAAAAIGSFFAGCVGTLVLAALAIPMADFALKFGPADYCSLMVLGLLGAVLLAHGSVLRAIGMILIGLLLGMVGTDVNSGVPRFDFGSPNLLEGIDIVVIAMGFFAIGEIVRNLEIGVGEGDVKIHKVNSLMPTRADVRQMTPAILRGTGLGAVLGILPGAGALLSSFMSYMVEKRTRMKPDEENFGEGNIRGVAGPEAANNAAVQSAFIPMLTLGIPPNGTMALMIGAMTIHNIQPGPQVMSTNPELFWGLIASMWIGNAALLIMNLPLVGVWTKLLQIPYRLLFPAIVVFCSVGAYTSNNSTFDVWMLALFGIIGYVLMRLKCEPAPLILGFILGPMFEENLRRTLLLSGGDWTVFLTKPISAVLLSIAFIGFIIILLPSVLRRRQEVFVED